MTTEDSDGALPLDGSRGGSTASSIENIIQDGYPKGYAPLRTHRSGPLTWAQQLFWFFNDPFFMEDWGMEPRMSMALRLPSRTSVADLEAALAASIERHEALRTVYERPDGDMPRQLVLDFHQPVIRIGPPEAVEPVSMFERPGFRCQAEVDGGTVVSAVLFGNAIDLDGASMALVALEVEDFLANGPRSPGAPAAGTMQPVDLARMEINANSSARTRGERAKRHIRDLRQDATRNFLPALSWKYCSGKLRDAVLIDSTVMTAAESVAERCRITVPSVFHAAICKVVGDWTRTSRFPFATAVANRWNREVRDYVGRLALAVDCEFELTADDTYRSVLERTHRSLVRSYLVANREYGACVMEGVRADEAVGSNLAMPILIEYLDYLKDAGINWPEGRHVRTAVDVGRTEHLRFHIVPLPNTTSINVNSDAAVLTETDVVDILSHIVDFIRSASAELDGPVRRSGHPDGAWGGKPGTRWLQFDASKHSANSIESNIEQCAGVLTAAVFAGDGDAVVAYVAGNGADLVEIHEHLLIETSQDPLIKIPSRYVLTSASPSAGRSETSWRELPVADRFDPAADYRERVVVDERFETLEAAFVRCHGHVSVVDPTKSYSTLNGSYLMIGGMLELLRGHGYTGLVPFDFLGLSSMASLAKRMRREGAELTSPPAA